MSSFYLLSSKVANFSAVERRMQSQWNDRDAAACADELALRVYSSRLLGRDTTLVLHGGGNTSLKARRRTIFGDQEDVLYVKGSGWDLATIEAAGFAPVRMAHLLRLATLQHLSDLDMARELRVATLDPTAPAPSVEAILHAILPYRFIDHSHADALSAIMNTPDGAERVVEIYGDSVVVIPYVMPGFELARRCAELFPTHVGPRTIGMVLLNHGLFSFGDTARESYERHVELVDRAETYLAKHGAWQLGVPSTEPELLPRSYEGTKDEQKPAHMFSNSSFFELSHPSGSLAERAALRREISHAAGAPLIMVGDSSPICLDFARRPDLSEITNQGPATPDHVIRTKRVPLIGRDVARYVERYKTEFAAYAASRSGSLTMLDPAPRIALDTEWGLCSLGRTVADAVIAGDVYRHTIDVIRRTVALGGYKALPPNDIFAVEYWDLEQAKLKRAGTPPPFAGEVALVTGAASGIGRACVTALRARGAAVAALDINPAISTMYLDQAVLGLQCDVSDETALAAALGATVQAFGGLDILVLNAGIFPSSRPIAQLASADWTRTLHINLDANMLLLRAAHPLLKLAPRGGRVAVIGSKNVPAPGPGAAAYSASKAALTQLARVAALEWAADNIRVNVLHPNAVFDTGIWTEDVLTARAASYGLSTEQYKTNNLLKTEVTSRHVAELAAELCGPLFACTTGAQIPIDGGNERVI